jgi:hypothetical protein
MASNGLIDRGSSRKAYLSTLVNVSKMGKGVRYGVAGSTAETPVLNRSEAGPAKQLVSSLHEKRCCQQKNSLGGAGQAAQRGENTGRVSQIEQHTTDTALLFQRAHGQR